MAHTFIQHDLDYTPFTHTDQEQVAVLCLVQDTSAEFNELLSLSYIER